MLVKIDAIQNLFHSKKHLSQSSSQKNMHVSKFQMFPFWLEINFYFHGIMNKKIRYVSHMK